MLLDTRDESSKEGFKPNVQNKIINSNCSKGGKFGYWFLFGLSWLTIIGGIVMLVLLIKTKNRINSSQIEINNAASNIDVQLAKRFDLLEQLQDQAISYLKHEGTVLKDVTSLRNGYSLDNKTAIEKQTVITQMQRQVDLTFENYPDLKAIQAINNLMSQSSMLTYEISAAQRTYNNRATQFNAEIVTWPTNSIIDNKKNPIHTFPLFEANEIQKTNPNFSKMLNIKY